MSWFKAFIAGFVATLIFHQGVLALLWLAGAAPIAPFNMTQVPPFHVPQVISLAFWGGIWGVPAWWVIGGRRGWRYWGAGLAFGAVLPTSVAMLLVFPLKGLEVTAMTVVGGLLLNGAWGLGVCLGMHAMAPRPS